MKKNLFKTIFAAGLAVLAMGCSDLVMDLRLPSDAVRNVPVPSDVDVTLDDNDVVKYFVIDEESKLSDGSEDSYIYDKNVCSAEVEEDTGKLTVKQGSANGETDVWVRVVNITPDPDEVLYRVRYHVKNDGKFVVDEKGFVQKTFVIEPTTKNADGTELENKPLAYKDVTVSPEDVVTAKVNDDGNVEVVPENPGTAKIVVDAKDNDGKDVIVVYDVTVDEEGKVTVDLVAVKVPKEIPLPATDVDGNPVSLTVDLDDGREVTNSNADSVPAVAEDGEDKIFATPLEDGTGMITVPVVDTNGNKGEVVYIVESSGDNVTVTETILCMEKKFDPITEDCAGTPVAGSLSYDTVVPDHVSDFTARVDETDGKLVLAPVNSCTDEKTTVLAVQTLGVPRKGESENAVYDNINVEYDVTVAPGTAADEPKKFAVDAVPAKAFVVAILTPDKALDSANLAEIVSGASSGDESVVKAELLADGTVALVPLKAGSTIVTVTEKTYADADTTIQYAVTVAENGSVTVGPNASVAGAKAKNAVLVLDANEALAGAGYDVPPALTKKDGSAEFVSYSAETGLVTISSDGASTGKFTAFFVDGEGNKILNVGGSVDSDDIMITGVAFTSSITEKTSSETVFDDDGTTPAVDTENTYDAVLNDDGTIGKTLTSSTFKLYPKKNFTAYQSVASHTAASDFESSFADDVITLKAEVTDGVATAVSGAVVTATGSTFWENDTVISYKVSVTDEGIWSYTVTNVRIDYELAQGVIRYLEEDEESGDEVWVTGTDSYLKNNVKLDTKSDDTSVVNFTYPSSKKYTLTPKGDGSTFVYVVASDAGDVKYSIKNTVTIRNNKYIIDYELAEARVQVPLGYLENKVGTVDLSATTSDNTNYGYQAVSAAVEVACENSDTVSAVGQTGKVTVQDAYDPSNTVTFATEIINGGIFTVTYPAE